jgi:hypothetical protein
MREELGSKWVFLIKAVGAMLALSAPLIVALMTWLVANSYGVQSKVSLLDYQMKQQAAAGPRYTKTNADADNAVLRHEIENDFRAALDPLIQGMSKIEGKMESMERTIAEIHSNG